MMLFILGAEMARNTKLEEQICRGLLRQSVQAVCGLSDPDVLYDYMHSIGFTQWTAILEEPTLAKRLANVGVKNPDDIIALIKRKLIERQSLFTLSAR